MQGRLDVPSAPGLRPGHPLNISRRRKTRRFRRVLFKHSWNLVLGY
jgi:hypothetical protein